MVQEDDPLARLEHLYDARGVARRRLLEAWRLGLAELNPLHVVADDRVPQPGLVATEVVASLRRLHVLPADALEGDDEDPQVWFGHVIHRFHASLVAGNHWSAGQLPELEVAAAAVTDALDAGLVAHDDVRAEERHRDRVSLHLQACQVEVVLGLCL